MELKVRTSSMGYLEVGEEQVGSVSQIGTWDRRHNNELQIQEKKWPDPAKKPTISKGWFA